MKPTIEFWRPETYGEVFDCWREVLRFLRIEMKRFNAADRNRVAEVLVTAASEDACMRIGAMAGEVMDILFDLGEDKEVNREPLVRL